MEFGKLELVEKTFVREVNNPRGQDYEGVKFRRFTSNKKGKEGQIEEEFTISDKLFDSLNLGSLALAQANTPQDVLLLVVDDQEEVKPVAKFMRQSKKKDGTLQAKGKKFSNSFLVDGLVERGILDEKTQDNQYLALVDVTGEFPDKPSVVHNVYKIVKDDSVDASQDTEEEVAQGQPQGAQDNF